MPKTAADVDPTTGGLSAGRAPRSTARLAWLIGPALVAGVAYLDPGNVASNMTAGAQYGYLLVWVVVLGNVMAWLIQYLSAKLGIVTGRSLPEMLGRRIRNRVGPARVLAAGRARRHGHRPRRGDRRRGRAQPAVRRAALWGGLITGTVSIVLLVLQSRRGPRTFEFVIMGLLAIIAIGFTVGVFVAPPDPAGVLGGLVPRFEDAGLGAARGIDPRRDDHAARDLRALGAQPRPVRHRRGEQPRGARSTPRPPGTAIGTRRRHETVDSSSSPPGIGDRPCRTRSIARALRATRWDVSIAMAIAGTVNLCILLLAAVNLAGVEGTDSLEGAYAALGVGTRAGRRDAVRRRAARSGLASTSVGAYAGAEIMHGLLHVRVPLIARRLVTLIPALAILALGFDPTLSLVLSQVVLSFGIPFALIPLVALTAKAGVLGAFTQPLGDDRGRDRGIRVPDHAQRRAALARVHRRRERPAGSLRPWPPPPSTTTSRRSTPTPSGRPIASRRRCSPPSSASPRRP